MFTILVQTFLVLSAGSLLWLAIADWVCDRREAKKCQKEISAHRNATVVIDHRIKTGYYDNYIDQEAQIDSDYGFAVMSFIAKK